LVDLINDIWGGDPYYYSLVVRDGFVTYDDPPAPASPAPPVPARPVSAAPAPPVPPAPAPSVPQPRCRGGSFSIAKQPEHVPWEYTQDDAAYWSYGVGPNG